MKKIKKNNKKKEDIMIISSIVLVILIILSICFGIISKITKEVKDRYGVKEAKIVGFHFCRVCDSWFDGCISYAPKYNCQEFTVEADGARGVVVSNEGSLDFKDVKLGLRCDKVIKQTLKMIDSDDYEYEEEIGVRRINIYVHKNLREILNLDYLNVLDQINLTIYEEFPSVDDSFGLQYDVYYSDGYIVRFDGNIDTLEKLIDDLFKNFENTISKLTNEKYIVDVKETDGKRDIDKALVFIHENNRLREVALTSPYGNDANGEKSIRAIKDLWYYN